MKKLANQLYEIGFPSRTVLMMIDMIKVAKLSDGRDTEDELFDWTPPMRLSKPTLPNDLDDDQTNLIIESLLKLEMTHGEISLFIHHVRALLAVAVAIGCMKKKVVH